MESKPETQISSSDAPPPAGASALPGDNEPQPNLILAGVPKIDAKPTMEEEKASLAAAVLACNAALDKLRLGKRDEAVEIIGFAYRKYPNCGIVRRCTALICLAEGTHGGYSQGYRWTFRNAAILYATGATDLAPDELVYEDPEKKEMLNVVIKICEVVNSMEDSVFYGIELLDKENNGVIQAGFDKIRKDFEKLIKMATDITVSDWLKYLPTVDQEKEVSIQSGETKSRWTGWICHSCADSDERFNSLKSLKQHTVLRHLGKLPPDSRSKLPKDVSEEWTELFVGVDDSLPSSSKNVSAGGGSSFLAMDDSVFKQISAFVHDAVRGPDGTMEGFHDQPMEPRTKEKAQQVSSLMESIVIHFTVVRGCLEWKSRYIRQTEELQKREEYLNYRIVLRKRMDQLEAEEVLDVKQQYEMEAIGNILVDGQPARAHQYGVNATYAERAINESLGIAIQIQKEQIDHEMKRIDSTVMQRVGCMMQLMEDVGAASVVDYGANLKSMMKYYTQIGEACARKYGDEMVEDNADTEGSNMC